MHDTHARRRRQRDEIANRYPPGNPATFASAMTIATAELFESLVGQDIAVATAAGAEPWRVLSVKRRQQHDLRSDQPFNVYLSAPARNDRRQGMRSGVLPGGETLEFFAVPIAATQDDVSYELVFN